MWELYKQNAGGIIGDEMGLGKTIQTIAFLAGLHRSGLLHHAVLVLCPATVMTQWVRECHRWYPPLRVCILHASGTFGGSKKQLLKQIRHSGGGERHPRKRKAAREGEHSKQVLWGRGDHLRRLADQCKGSSGRSVELRHSGRGPQDQEPRRRGNPALQAAQDAQPDDSLRVPHPKQPEGVCCV